MAPDYLIKGISEKKAEDLKKLGLNLQRYVPQMKQVSEISKSEKNDWIVMPKEFSKLSYNLAISPGRIAYSPAVEKAGKTLGLHLRNTAEDSLYRKFVGRVKWDQAMKLNLLMGNRSLMPKEAVNFWYLLDEGAKGNIAVRTRDGERLKKEDLKKIKDDMIKIQSPGRGEWLDAIFEKNENGFYLMSKHILQNNELVPEYSEAVIENTLNQHRMISLESLFKTKNKQGFPTKETKKGNITYIPPTKHENSVCISGAGIGWSIIDFLSPPFIATPSIGIRAAEQIE